MSPEVLLSDNYNELVDIWSLGSVAWHKGADSKADGGMSACWVLIWLHPPCASWLLSITAYELAVGQPPHAELHSLRAALKIPMCDPPTLPNPSRFSPELHSFIKSCLVKDYTRRPSATELLQHPFITKNASAPSILLEMVQKTMATNESKAAAEGNLVFDANGKPIQAKLGARSHSEPQDH